MKQEFGIYKNQAVSLYILENEQIKIELSDFGARIVSCVLKKNGKDIIQGFDNPQGFDEDVRYMGATVGRVANRINAGKFSLNGKEYHLPINNNGNTLHGGPNGFDLKIFDAEEYSDKVVFYYESPDGEEGFPGRLNLKVTYQLIEDGWVYETEAFSDKDTLCSITNHAFFNMNGQESETAMNHEVQIFAENFSAVDENGLTLPIIKSVENTSFDFREPVKVLDRIMIDDEDLKAGSGFDHSFIIDGEGLKRAVKVKADAGIMEIYTTMPCLQFYSGNFLDGTSKGKNGASYPCRSALCFEPQYYPNAIEYDCAEKPILKANEVMKHRTEYHYIQEEN